MNTDSLDKIQADLLDLIKKETSKSFDEGALSIIEILREGLEVTGLDHVPTKWLDTAEEALKKK